MKTPLVTAWRGLACATLAALVGGCSSPAQDADRTSTRAARGSGWSDLGQDVRPSLEEIFLQPPISGDAPTSSSFSPDGRWLVLRWKSQDDEGDRVPLRLFDLEHPEASDWRGIPLAELVPDFGGHGDGKEIRTVVWGHHGARLAIARGPDILLFDPSNNRVSPLLLPPIDEPEEEPEANAEDDGADDVALIPEPTPALPTAAEGERVLSGSIRSLRFGPDDDTLRFIDAKELYSLPIPAAGLPDAPASLDEATLWSEFIDPMPLRAQWSRDLRVVVSIDPALLDPEDEAVEERATVPQVYLLDEDRYVSLIGVGADTKIENANLSPDGRFYIGAEYDRETEPDQTLVPDYLTDRVSTRKTRRFLADDGPSPFKLYVWQTSSGERTLVFPKDEDGIALDEAIALDEEDPDGNLGEMPDADDSTEPAAAPAAKAPAKVTRRLGDHYLRTIGWAPNIGTEGPARFAYELTTADQRELEIWCWTEGFCERLWFERDERWVGGPARYARWTDDGTRLIVGSEAYAESTTPGRCQVFSIDPDTREIVQLTEVAGEVRRFQTTDDGALIYQASEEDLAQTTIGWLPAVQVNGGFRPEPRTFPAPAGWNSSTRASSDGTRVVFSHESLFRPAELWVTDRDGARQLTRTTPEAFDEVDWIAPQRVALESPDGRTVWAHVFVPPGASLEAAGNREPRATIVFVHGAGYLQNVTDSMTRYPLNLMFHSRLAQLGYPVIDVDYRGSAGYGHDFRTDVQYHLGGKDLDDIHLVVDEFIDRGLVDPERVGIYGGSYGGFMTMMALFTAPDRWAAGAALRSVTDWRTYNPWYTQARLGSPSTHPEAYELSSPIDHVEKIEDPLLVLHGMMDSNVFAQDSIRLIEALIDQGSDFDAMLYPSQGHGFEDGPHWLDEYRRIERFLRMHLGPALRATESKSTRTTP